VGLGHRDELVRDRRSDVASASADGNAAAVAADRTRRRIARRMRWLVAGIAGRAVATSEERARPCERASNSPIEPLGAAAILCSMLCIFSIGLVATPDIVSPVVRALRNAARLAASDDESARQIAGYRQSHHSVWGVEALKTGAFTPPALVGPVPVASPSKC